MVDEVLVICPEWDTLCDHAKLSGITIDNAICRVDNERKEN